MFPKCQRLHGIDDVQLGLVIAACEEGRADTHFDTSPDFLDYDDYDPYYCCGDEMRDYLHLNTDQPNSFADAAGMTENAVAAAAAAEDFAAVAVSFQQIYDHRRNSIVVKKKGLLDLFAAILFYSAFQVDPSFCRLKR